MRLLSITSVCLIVCAAAAADFRTKSETRGPVTAWLDVTIAKPNEPGIAEATLVVHVDGPRGLEAKIEIDDARWTATLAPPTLGTNNPVAWTQAISLKQKTPGQVPLPAVKVSFRAGPEAAWETVEWPDLLRQVVGQPTPVDVPEPPSTPTRWRAWMTTILMVTVVGIFALLLLRRPRHQAAALTVEQRAAGELADAETLLATDVTAAHKKMADVVRGFVAERLPGVKAQQLTTEEFLDAVRRAALVEDELREFCERCDFVRFAGVRPEPAETRRTLEMARALIHHFALARNDKSNSSVEAQ